MAEKEYNIFDLGFNKYLSKGSSALDTTIYQTLDDLLGPSIMGNGFYEVPPSQIGSGELGQNLTMVAGLIQSANYVSGSAGWAINYDGSAEFSDITLYGGTIKYGKTSFTDSTNGGYWVGSSGFYIGGASDVTKLKYTIADGTLSFIGILQDSAGAALLNSSAKTILKDFTFSPDDYSGALKAGNVAWNTTTGAITSGTGIVVFKGGIIGAKDGDTTFSISSSTGDAYFAGTLSAASGTLGSITIGTNAWHIDSSGNMWWGNYANYAAGVDKISSSGVWSRLRVNRTTAGTGLYYENTGNVQNVGVDIEMGTGVNLTNTLAALRVNYGGTGDILYGNISSTGRGIQITRTIGAGTANLLYLYSSNATAGTMFNITRTGSGVLQAIEISQTTSSSSINTGILMSLSSGNASLCYAARFNGSEIVSAAVGGTQNKKIRISVSGTDYYIPCYTS